MDVLICIKPRTQLGCTVRKSDYAACFYWVYFISIGCPVGTIITMPLSGLLTKYGPDGWASAFYCFGKSMLLLLGVYFKCASVFDCQAKYSSIE